MAKKKQIQALSKANSERLAKKIWHAGLGAYGAAYDVRGHRTDEAFEALSKRGKAFEKVVKGRAGKTAAVGKLNRQITTIGRQIAKLNAKGPKSKKRAVEDRSALIEALGLSPLVAAQSKDNADYSAHIDALEEMVAQLKASALADDQSANDRLRRLAVELSELSGPAPKPVTNNQGRLETPYGVQDDLKQIRGVGVVLERKLNDAGIYHFWQVAALTDKQVADLEADLSFPGRIGRDNWRAQAQRFATEST